jgi:hypothetical protein
MNEFIEYKNYRTGFSFTDIRRMLQRKQKEARHSGKYIFVTRATVLGFWHEIKLKLYNDEAKLFNQLSKYN